MTKKVLDLTAGCADYCGLQAAEALYKICVIT
jgi:hypothetical protein